MGYYLLDYNPGTQQYGYPRRGGVQLSGTVIVHTAECARDDIGEDSSAETCANFIANRADYGSYHRLVDSDSIIPMVPWEYEAWQDSETNNWAVGISAALATSDWLTMPSDRRDAVYRNLATCGAEFVLYMRDNYGIDVPRRRITGAEARNRVPGFCAHGDSGIARSDPGANFDWDLFFYYINQYLDNGSIQEDELSQEAEDRIVHRVNVFAQQNANDVAATVINEVRVHSKFNADRVLDALKSLPQIDNAILDGIKKTLAEGADETVAQIREKLDKATVTVTLGTKEGA